MLFTVLLGMMLFSSLRSAESYSMTPSVGIFGDDKMTRRRVEEVPSSGVINSVFSELWRPRSILINGDDEWILWVLYGFKISSQIYNVSNCVNHSGYMQFYLRFGKFIKYPTEIKLLGSLHSMGFQLQS